MTGGVTKFSRKRRDNSLRLKDWNYSSDGAYFITICIKNRNRCLGEIIKGVFIGTVPSKICMDCWLGLIDFYPNCIFDEFVIMPDHVHGIIFVKNGISSVGAIHESPRGLEQNNDIKFDVIHESPGELGQIDNAKSGVIGFKSGAITGAIRESPLRGDDCKIRRQMLISKIIGRFKMQTAKRINEYQKTSGMPFWQLRFYDHIIKNEKELIDIRRYIKNNPVKYNNK